MKRKPVAIRPMTVDFKEFDRIIIGCPVWAEFPAPAFNAIVEMLPAGKEVEVFLCSGGGDSQKTKQGTKELIESKGCTMVDYRDVITNESPRKMKE